MMKDRIKEEYKQWVEPPQRAPNDLYDPNCATAIYYFIEEIVVWEDGDEESDEMFYGAFDIYSYCDKVGIKIDRSEGGKYGRSFEWD